MFFPTGAEQRIASIEFEQAEAVIFGPAAAGGIDNESAAVMLEDLRAFADGHIDRFPVMFGFGDEDAFPRESPGIDHGRDVKVLASVFFAGPAGPDKEKAEFVQVQ